MRTMQSHHTLHGRSARPSLGKTLRDAFLAADRLLALWQARHEHRQQLRQMPSYLLRDVGLSDERALEEARKPFWRE